MTLAEWIAQARKTSRVPTLDVELIAKNCFAPERADRSWLVAHSEIPVGGKALSEANDLLERRRRGMPLAYLLGTKEFYGREFEVTPEVLIPRPETEALIDLVKGLQLPRRPVILDVGTGSGCVAITLALEFPQAAVFATDISQAVLDVAKRNDARHEGRVLYGKSDLFTEISFVEDGPFDVVVANLPYVNPEWDWLDLKALAAEPKEALFVAKENGLGLYRRFFKALDWPGEVGLAHYVVVEADPCQHAALKKLARRYGWKLCGKQGYGLAFEAIPGMLRE